jgi:hypothetical protein
MFGRREEMKWVSREGGVIVVMMKMWEKKEREEEVMMCGVEGMKEFLHSSKQGRKRRRKEMKGMKDLREEMWNIERKGGRDSLFSFLCCSFVWLFGKGAVELIGGFPVKKEKEKRKRREKEKEKEKKREKEKLRGTVELMGM